MKVFYFIKMEKVCVYFRPIPYIEEVLSLQPGEKIDFTYSEDGTYDKNDVIIGMTNKRLFRINKGNLLSVELCKIKCISHYKKKVMSDILQIDVNTDAKLNSKTFEIKVYRTPVASYIYDCVGYWIKERRTIYQNTLVSSPISLSEFKRQFDKLTGEMKIEPEPQKRVAIRAALRSMVWDTYVSTDYKKGKCFCCRTREITTDSFECGHVISVKDGGSTDLSNLRPICGHCNKSMSATNMYDFIKNNRFWTS